MSLLCRGSFCAAVAALLLFAGCSKSAKTDAPDEKSESEEITKIVIPTSESLAGRWMLEFYAQQAAIPLAILEIQEKSGQWQITMPAHHPNLQGGLKLEEAKSDGKLLNVLITSGAARFHFEGQFLDGGVFGNMLHPEGIDPARLVPTAIETMDGIQPRRVADYETVGKASSDIDPIGEMKSFISNNVDSPASLLAYDLILTRAKRRQMSAAEVEKVALEYEQYAARWGKRLANMATFNCAMNLGAQQYLPQTALKLIDRFESNAVDDDMRTAATRAREHLKVVAAIDGIESDEAARRDESQAILTKMLETTPVNGPVRLALAYYERDHGEKDKAMEHFATLSVLPSMEKAVMDKLGEEDSEAKSPTEELAALWKEKHGSEDGLADYSNAVYTEFLSGMTRETVPARGDGEGTRRVLLELFTGAQCAPCVAADLGAELLERTYQPTELIALRYHEHIPAGDPLSNREVFERMGYYGARGTPTLLLNGRAVEGAGGFLPQIGPVEAALRPLVDSILKEASPIRFDMKAVRDGNNLQISVSVEGIKLKVDSEFKLRMALVENGIQYVAPNGIRVHNKVVRAMPGTVNGVSISESKISFSETLSIDELKDRLNNELDSWSDLNNASLTTRPLDLKNLQLVAFIQDDENRRILQSDVTDFVDGPVSKNDADGTQQKQSQPATETKDKKSEAEATKGKDTSTTKDMDLPSAEASATESDAAENESARQGAATDSTPAADARK